MGLTFLATALPRSGYGIQPRVAALSGYPGNRVKEEYKPQLGFLLFRNCFLSQGSREARQPWAVSRNRFAVLLQDTNDNLLKAYADLKR